MGSIGDESCAEIGKCALLDRIESVMKLYNIGYKSILRACHPQIFLAYILCSHKSASLISQHLAQIAWLMDMGCGRYYQLHFDLVTAKAIPCTLSIVQKELSWVTNTE